MEKGALPRPLESRARVRSTETWLRSFSRSLVAGVPLVGIALLVFRFCALSALCSWLLVPAFFVSMLYIWDGIDPFDRNHPRVIRLRFVSVAISTTCVFIFAYWWLRRCSGGVLGSPLSLLGVRVGGTVTSLILPQVLVAILFAGPLVMEWLDEWEEAGAEVSDKRQTTLSHVVQRYKQLWDSRLRDVKWWRDIVAGPLSEEICFRACLCPLLLLSGWRPSLVVFLSPIGFGLAHVHHITQHLHKQGRSFRDAWLGVLFQFSYTTLFGAYTAFLFLRTGHLLAPFLTHAFCNTMGFPAIDAVPAHSRRNVIAAAYVGGLVGFFLLLFPLTAPSLYSPPFASMWK